MEIRKSYIIKDNTGKLVKLYWCYAIGKYTWYIDYGQLNDIKPMSDDYAKQLFGKDYPSDEALSC